MKDHYKSVRVTFTRWLMSLAVLTVLLTTNANAQVTVTNPTNTTPALLGTYPTLAAAITDLNLTTAISGQVIIELAGNETAPAGGYSITAIPTGASATNNIIIQGNASTITASGALTVGALNDALFKLVGADFITIQNFTMQENAANTVTTAASNTMTEWGVALLYATTTNGAQNNTIKNNTISLNRTYQNTFGIYANATHSATAVTTSATATTTAGGNTGLKIYGNNISNINNGIIVVGPTAVADNNNGIDIGGTGGAQANTITNYGTTGTFSGYANVSGTVNGILVRNTINANISFNTITSSVGGVTAGTLNGIQVPAASTAPTATFTNTINNNIISLKSGLIAGAMVGISYPSGSASATSTLNINNNDFNNFGHTVAGTAAITFITVASTNQFTTINNNTFTNMSVNTTGSVTFIVQSFTAPSNGTKAVNGNSIVTGFTKTGAGGTILLVSDNGSTVAGAISNCQNNNFSNISVTGATTLTGLNYTDGGTAATRTVTGNTLNNWTGGTAAINCMNFTYWNGVSSLSSNTVTNITGQSSVTGVTIGSSVSTATSVAISSNTINNLSSTGAGGAVTGISCSNTSTLINISSNTINTLSSTGASAVSGISISGATTTNAFKNKIYDLSGSNASSTVNGILVSAGSTVNLYNNLVGDLRATIANAANPIVGLNITGGTTINAYYNSVYLNATSSGALFGSSAISASSTPTLTLRNNIFTNLSTPVGATGFTSAYRRSSTTLTSYGATSGNNDFYAGTPGANNLIMYDGTNSYQTLATYQTAVGPTRDASSKSENPTWISTTGSSSNFLHIDAAVTTLLESGASNIATYTDDFDGQTRQGNVGYAGTGTAPDIGADEFNGISPAPAITLNSVTPPATTQCTASSRLVSVNVTTPSGSITSVSLSGNNGAAFGPISMTNTSGTTWEGTIPVASPTNSIVSWSVTAVNSIPLTTILNGSSYADEPLFGVSSAISASVNPVPFGSSTVLTAALSKPGTAAVGLGASTSSSSGSTLFPGAWGGAKTQFIIKASELTASGFGPGNFTALGFEPTTSGQTYTGFAVSMAQIGTTAAMTSTLLSPAGITQVYAGTLTDNGFLPVAGSLNTLVFGTGGTSSSFAWDGSQNILVSVCWSTVTGATTSTGSTVKVDAPGFTCTGYGQIDATLPSVVCPMTTGFGTSGTGTNRPKFTFTANLAPSISSILWSNGSTTNPTTVSPVAATTYTAAIVSSGCTVSPSPSLFVDVIFPPVITFNSITPSTATLCAATARLVSVDVITVVGTITSVTLQGNNGAAFGPITMTNTSGNTWTGTIPAASPANANVTWTVIASNSIPLSSTYTGTSYADAPLFGMVSAVSASTNPIAIGGSTTLTASINNGPAVPAASAYCQSTHTSGCSGDDMTHIVLNTLNSTASACGLSGSTPPRYLYTTGGPATNTTILTAGTSYNLSVTFGTDGSQYFGAWIDYNHDGTYASSEYLGGNPTTAGGSGTATISFVVPTTSYNGLTHIRVIGGNDSPLASTQACGASSSGWGETQDYDLTIAGAPAISSVTWNDGTSDFSTANPVTVTPSLTTTYTATITSGACTVTPSPSQTVTVLFPPSISFNSITPGTTSQCVASSRLVSVDVTTAAGTITGVTLQGNNGAAFGPIAMTNSSGNTWTGTIPVASPANSLVSWSVIASNSVPLSVTFTGTSYQDEPLFGVTAAIASSANPICVGSSANLTAQLSTGSLPAAPAASAYCASTHANGCSGDNVASVALNTLSNTTGTTCGTTSAAYSNFSGLGGTNTTTLAAGTSYPLTLSFGSDGNQYFGAWIDYNHDGTYSAAEFLGASGNAGSSGSTSVTFTVNASTAYNGLTHMRVIGGNDSPLSSGQACGASSSSFGETQDYDVTITGALSSAPYAGAITSISWSDGATTVGSTNPLSVSPVISTTYTATIVAGGCTVSPSPSLLVNVSTPPTAPTANNVTGCSGLPTASVTSTTGLPTPTFKWYDAASGGNLLQTSASTTFSTSITSTTTWYVSELNVTTGCESGRTAVTQTIYTLTITSDFASFCSTGGAQTTGLHATSSNPSFTYTWTALSAGSVSPSSGANVTASLSTTSDYLVTAVNGGCTMTTSISIGVYDFPTPNLTSNGPVCDGSNINLNSGFIAGSFSASSITFAPLTAPVTAVNLVTNGVFTPPLGQTQATSSSDDGGWSQIPIPFNFSFFGTAYNAINVSTNGTLNFGPYVNFNASQYSFPGGFPSTSSPANTIAVAAHDMNTSTGNIRYWTAGVSPNRKFIIEYNGVKDFSGTLLNTAEAIFYETTGVIEIHVTSSPSTSYARYVGLQDGTQTIGAAPVNGATAAISNQAWRFDPANHYSITWTGTNLTAPLSGTDLFTETTTAMTAGAYTYTFVGTDQTTGCTNATNPASIIVNVRPLPVDPIASASNICGAKSTTLTVSNAGLIGVADTIRWYNVATGGSVIGRGASYITPIISASTSYWVETYNGACLNPSGRLQVDVNVGTAPGIVATGPLTQVCPAAPITLDATSANPDYTYNWTPGSLTGATQNINAPATTTTYTVTAIDNTAGPFAGCQTSATVLVDVRNTATVNAGVDLLKNIGGTATLTASYQTPGGCLKITEITLFKTGTGSTPSYPAYAVGDDLLEITNSGTSAAAIGGLHLRCEGVRTMNYIFPAATIPAGGVVIVNFGTGTDDLVNNAFFTGGQTGSTADQWSSGTANGIWLTQTDGITVIDAVATNAWTFSVGSGVSALDWSGTGASGLSGNAGTRLTGPDLNNATGWVTAASSTQDQGTVNSGVPLNCNASPYTVTWTGGNLTGPSVGDVVTTPVFIAPPQTWTYTVSLTDGVCTTTDNVDVTTQFPVAPTANFSVNSVNHTTGATTSTAIFTDLSLNIPDTYSWSITGPGVVTYVNSTTSASQNPQVQFGGIGQYTVALTVSNAAGTDTKTMTNYITVNAVYCASNATSTSDEEIFGVTFAGINNVSNCGQTGGSGSILNEYSNYTGITPAEVAVGYTFPFTLKTSACGTGTFSAGYSVYIDFNQDGDFADAGESVFASTVTTPTPPSVLTTFTGNVTIPMTASIGLTRMRVVLTEGNATPPACGTYGFGETEDYTININPQPTSAPTCPSGIAISGATCITATSLSWSASTGFPQGYYLYIGTDGGGVATPTNLLFGQDVGSNLSATLPTLAPNTLYYYQVSSYNTFGENTTCSIGSFTSGASTTQTPTQAPSSYKETIDNGVVPPAVPCGMTTSNENFPVDAFTWYSSIAAPHSGLRHLAIDKNSNNTTPKDDWFYSAPMNLTAGHLYRIYFWHRVSTAGTETFEAFLSSSPDAATMLTTSAVFNGSSNLLTYKLDSSSDILPATNGIYYYGFHANGAANGRSLYMDDIQVREIPVAALNPASCTTIPTMYDQLLVQPIYGAQDYKFRIENLATSFSYEYTRNLPIPDFRLKWAPGVVYDLTYDVAVSYKKNNVWSPYGASCPVTMGPFPTTKLRGASCGATLTDQYTQLFIDSVSGANDYEYRIVQSTLAYDHTWMRGAPVLDYRLYWAYQTAPTLVDRIPYGFTYDVQVRALVGKTGPAQGNLPGVFGTFGPVCQVTLAGQPQTQLKPTSCGVTLANITDQIFCVPVTGASNYRYHVVNTALGYDVTAMRNSSVNDYRLTWLPTVSGVGLRFGTTYDITVSDFVGGVWSTEGPMCQVTTPAQPLTQLQPAYCLYTLPTFSTTIFSTAVAGATNYRYRITDAATSGATYTKIVARNSPGNDFKFSWTLVCCGGLNVLPNQPYHVEVASYAGGVWSAYGSICTVTTSATVPRYSPFLAEDGLTEGAQNLNLSVYPNPAAVAEEFAIELSGIQAANSKVEISIYNMLGAKAYSSEVVTKTESNLIIKPEQVLAPGVYMVEAKLDGNVYREKFVVK